MIPLTAISTQKEFNVETPLSHLAHLEITAPDVESSARFYEEKFGMRIVDRAGGSMGPRAQGLAGLIVMPRSTSAGAESHVPGRSFRFDPQIADVVTG